MTPYGVVRKFAVFSLTALACAGACDGGGGTDSNTNWLEPCGTDSDCGSLECVCGVCTKPCTATANCSGFDDAVCRLDDASCRSGYCARSSSTDGGTPDASAGGAGTGGTSSGGSSSGGSSSGGSGGTEPDASTGGSSSGGGSGGAPSTETDASTDAGPDGSVLPPFAGILDFSFPTAHSMTDAAGMRVSGIIDPAEDIVSVTVNSFPAESLEGSTFARWRTTSDVPLALGKNAIHVVVQRSAGPELTLDGTVWRAPASTADHLSPVQAGVVLFPRDIDRLVPTSLARDRAHGTWVLPFFDGPLGDGLANVDDLGVWSSVTFTGFEEAPAMPSGVQFFARFFKPFVVAEPGNVYASSISALSGPGVPSGTQALIGKINDSGTESPLWLSPFTGAGPLRFALDTPRTRVLTVRESPQIGLVGIDTATGVATVLSDATHGSGALFVAGAPIAVQDATHAFLPGCRGATAVDLTTGDRTTWGAASTGTCVVAEGAYSGGVVALEESSPRRWQVRLLDPVAKTASPLFEVIVNGTLTSATIDPVGAQLALGVAAPFGMVAYALADGTGPRQLTFGAGPALVLDGDLDDFDTAVLGDGRLVIKALGQHQLDPDTGVRGNVSIPGVDPGALTLYPDEISRHVIAATRDDVYRVAADLSSSTRIGDSVGFPLAYDITNHTLYGYAAGGVITAFDVTAGTRNTLPSSTDLTLALNCAILESVVVGDVLYIDSYATGPAPSRCGLLKINTLTGAVSDTTFSDPTRMRDGRLVTQGSQIDVIDPVTEARTVLSRFPDIGRGFPFPSGSSRRSLAGDPRRDRLWYTLAYRDDNGTPSRFFVIDPFNGDRALVAE